MTADENTERLEEREVQTRDNVHLLSLALIHLETCIRLLNKSGVRVVGDGEFIRACKSVRDLRNALEHEEEYIAEFGKVTRFRELAWIEDGYPDDVASSSDENGVHLVRLMGRNYDVRPAIVAASSLEAELDKLMALEVDRGHTV